MFSPVIGQNSERAAVRKALDRHKVYITAQSFSAGAYQARVLVDGEAYLGRRIPARPAAAGAVAGRARIDAGHRRLSRTKSVAADNVRLIPSRPPLSCRTSPHGRLAIVVSTLVLQRRRLAALLRSMP